MSYNGIWLITRKIKRVTLVHNSSARRKKVSVSWSVVVNWPVYTLLEGDLAFWSGDFGQEGYEGPYQVEEA